ncbi:metallophosphoesterase [Kribbella sp. VKM Ac-2566]|uniref:metallophosphoesterase family protein n=1 Tax=Kribbella sp. VKM Ac-2566 TaxID=2512218 RepID=UPI001EDECABD|nr:metallophosphoesterase family protein [Kribbella sp. VKM Ac-2566]
MSVAVLSDVHGVLPVLQAVLAEPDVTSADRIVLTGDIVAGPQPVAVLDRLLQLGDRVIMVRGNADRDIVTLATGDMVDSPFDIDVWAAKQLSPQHIDVLAALQHPVTLHIDGFGPVLFCHGSPRDDNEVVLVDTRLSRWAEAFADVPDEVRTIVCGHTHMPFMRLVDRRLVINSGSIGMPYGAPVGHWVHLMDGNVSLRRTDMDADSVVEQIVAGSTYPDRRAWADEYIRAVTSDAEALAVFAPRDGRSAAGS